MSDTSPLVPGVSPLTEADPDSINLLIKERIDEIFNKPPLLLSDDDLKVAVSYYRKERQRFMLESQAKAAAGPKPRRKAAGMTTAEILASPMEDLL